MPVETVFVNIVFEDSLSEAIIEHLLKQSPVNISIHRRINGHGCGYIRAKITSFFSAAAHQSPFFVLMDSDKDGCALRLLDKLVPMHMRNKNCIFRIAVREVEAWLLSDHVGIGLFFGISEKLINANPESLEDPKGHLIQLARKSSKNNISKTIPPLPHTNAVIGPEYNQTLLSFIQSSWNIKRAAKRSESLRRAIRAVQCFKP